jgi:L-rhamnose isomerase
MLKALLLALLEPAAALREMELEGDYTGRLAMLEQLQTMPFGAVWDHHCESRGVPQEPDWIHEIRSYERTVLSRR